MSEEQQSGAPFKREDRYIVIKRSDVEKFWRDDVREQFMAALQRLNEHHVRIPQRKYAVIESDWPEYELVWQMIEARVTGAEQMPMVGGQTSSLNGKPDDYESRRSWTAKDWYTHLGAWENEKGQLCFGSTIAFAIMLEQFHRTHAAPLATYVDYVTQPAESLAGIACRQLNDERRWIEIRDINAHAFPDMAPHDYYPVGTRIKLPRP